MQVHLVHSGDHLLPSLNRKLGEYGAQTLKERGLKLVLNQRVKSITANRVYLESGSIIETNTVISTVGNAPHPLVTALGAECAFEMRKGCIVTESTGQVKGQTHLWAMGDCAAFPAVAGGDCPNTAQFAFRQGALVGRNIARTMRQQKPRPIRFKGLGEIASIGHHVAVADILGVQFSGFFAWWLWRSVYLLKLPRFDRKIRVMLDWTLDLFFPRDLNHLSPRFSKSVNESHLESGDRLFHKGEPAFSFYIVKSGALEILDGDEIIQRITAGGYFGEQALLEGGIGSYDARAIEPTDLASVPASIFHQLARGGGSLGHFFQKSAAKYQSQEIVEAIGRKIDPNVAAQPISLFMERKLHTLSPGMMIRETLQVIRDHPRSSYPVVGAGEKLLGLMRREDFYEFLKRPDTRAETPMANMTFTSVPAVSADTTVGDVMKCFIRSGSNKVLVVDGDNRLQGIATVMDLFTAGTGGAGQNKQ
ncbi:MAG: cyclic nucleotide-binding domain-containing protein [Verrucomicrobia bacterium]|nr:cyclic nucleotide-binding domain-containing protein [Verrucomicrobiota bacterium]